MAPNNKFFARSDWSHSTTITIGQPHQMAPKNGPCHMPAFPNEFPMNDIWDYLLICSSAVMLCTLLTKKVRGMDEEGEEVVLPCPPRHDSNGHDHFCTIAPEHRSALSQPHGAHRRCHSPRRKPNPKVRHFRDCAPCRRKQNLHRPRTCSLSYKTVSTKRLLSSPQKSPHNYVDGFHRFGHGFGDLIP